MVESKNNKIFIAVSVALAGLIIFFLSRKATAGNIGFKGLKNKNIKAGDWSNDTNYFVNKEGKDLFKIAKSAGITLSRNTGLNSSGYSQSKYAEYKTNKNIFWAIYDINNDTLLASSSNGKENVYGASVPKVCVAASAFDNKGGILPSDSDYQKVIKLLVKSDNVVWNDIQNLAGGSNAVNKWAEKMGYTMKPARNGGNNSNAIDMCKFWSDICHEKIKGAENIFKLSNSCQTSSSRSRKFMPKEVFIGGKTGTWKEFNHDTSWIQNGDRFYSICVLTKLGANGSVAVATMYRGLYDEYANK